MMLPDSCNSGLCPPQEMISAVALYPLIRKKVKPFSSRIGKISSDEMYSGLSALIPRANDGQVPVELLTGPTRNVFTSFSKIKSSD